MTAPAWCPSCAVETDFAPSPVTAYSEICSVCGHVRVERTRPARMTLWLEMSQQREDR